MNSRQNQPIETLRISDRDKARLIQSIEESRRQDYDSNLRRLRVAWPQNEVVLTLLGEAGESIKLSVLGRNLSRWGVSLIHGRYIYPGTRCEVQMRALAGGWHTRQGEVLHIRHVHGLVHELAVRFDSPVDLSEFATLSPEEETQHLQELADDMPASDSDTVDQVASRVLVVDDFASDRKLFGHWLSRTGMVVSTAGDCKSARERVEEAQFDLIVVDLRLGDESGNDLIRSLRNAQFVAPILAVSADDDPRSEQQAVQAGANRFLAKPFNAEALVQTSRSLMGFDQDMETEPMYSALNDDQEMRPLLTEFTRRLSGYMDQLREANAKQDYEALDTIARTLKGTGTGYGFDLISEHAGRVLLALNDSAADIDAIKHAANDLVCILNRVRVR